MCYDVINGADLHLLDEFNLNLLYHLQKFKYIKLC